MKELEAISKEHRSNIAVLRWFARVWSLAVVTFTGFFLVMHLFGDPGGSMRLNGTFETVRFLCFPVGLVTGLLLGWKSELWGGLLTVCSIAGFHLANQVVLGNAQLDILITGFVIPGLLYLLVWRLDGVR